LRIDLYRDEAVRIGFDQLANYLRDLGFEVSVEDSLVGELSPRDVTECKVRNAFSDWEDFEPLLGEVRYEERMREKPEKIGGILYDASRLREKLAGSVEGSVDEVHVVFTDRLLGTFSGGRYHVRTVYMSSPSLVSVAGLVEGPARPDEFYERKSTALGEKVPSEVAKQGVEGDFLEHGDPRLTEVAKGMVLQAAFYRATGEAFCGDPGCRLFNAHRQEALLAAQLESKLCEKHDAELDRIIERGKND